MRVRYGVSFMSTNSWFMFSSSYCSAVCNITSHWGRDKMADFWQKTLSNALPYLEWSCLNFYPCTCNFDSWPFNIVMSSLIGWAHTQNDPRSQMLRYADWRKFNPFLSRWHNYWSHIWHNWWPGYYMCNHAYYSCTNGKEANISSLTISSLG